MTLPDETIAELRRLREAAPVHGSPSQLTPPALAFYHAVRKHLPALLAAARENEQNKALLANVVLECSKARALLAEREARAWNFDMSKAPRDGTRVLLMWAAVGDLSAHVELGKFKSTASDELWCNTYGSPFSGEPDAWMRLPEAAEREPAGTREGRT